MKKHLIITLIVAAIHSLPAQIPVNTEVTPDYFQYKAGHMFWCMENKETQLNGSVRLINGMIVNSDGTFKKPNKKPQQLTSGEFLDIDGKVFKTKDELDAQITRHREALNREYLLFQNGEVVQIKNGTRIILEDKITLANGTLLYPNGLCQLKTGTKLNLHEGECLDMHGRKYSDAWTFHLQMEKMMAVNRD